MNCCIECFSSPYLKDIIIRNDLKGNCEFCFSDGTYIYDTKELSLIFQNILDLYSVNNEIGNAIQVQIEADFPNKIFSNKILEESRSGLLKAIVENDFESYSHLFENNVIFTFINDSIGEELINPLQISWDKFAEEIKSRNRFHIQNTLDLDKLKILLNRYSKPIHKGRIFYRGRISSSVGFEIVNMGNPPSEKSKSGRANPTGISYLYIADQLETTLYETRASLLDYVTIGKFRLKENIKVVNLRGNIYDPILLAENEELEDFMIHLPFISKLEQELSKPNRRNDIELDYLPTQYLSEFIKSIGYDGVEYQSSLYSEGYNLAIFNVEKFECINVELHEISEIKFIHNKL
jgi:hypothetical protein